MSLYARANLFVGKYKIPLDGHIRLGSRSRVRYLRGREGPDGWQQDEAGDLWLIVIRLESGLDQPGP